MINMNDAEFFKKLLCTFKIEAHEHLRTISLSILHLEETSTEEQKKTNIETIHREFHSLKGAARAVNMNEIETICHSTENIFSKIKKGILTLNPEMFDVFNLVIDTIEDILFLKEDNVKDISLVMAELKKIESGVTVCSSEIKPSDETVKSDTDIVFDQIVKCNINTEEKNVNIIKDTKEQNSNSTGIKDNTSQIVRVSKAKLDSLMLEGEEMIYAKLSALERAREIKEIKELLDLCKKERKSNTIEILENNIIALIKSTENDAKIIETMTDNFIEDIKDIMLLPFSSIVEMFPKMVRDLSRHIGKKVEFISEGTEIEIDRRILEEIKDPLMHIIRNSIDHGIEKSEERERLGKNSKGIINLIVTQVGSDWVKIEISDDGSGIDINKVKEKAVKNNILTRAQANAMNDKSAKMLIFKSGMSTSDIITDISGRGLGLAIVYEKVQKLEGTIRVKSEKKMGTIFTIMLPITISTNRGIMVREAKQNFIIPTGKVEKVMRIKKEEIKMLEGRSIIQLEESIIPIVKLKDILELQDRGVDDVLKDTMEILIVNDMQNKIAFSVDKIVIEQEVLVKRFNKQLKRVRNIAGATILGSGEVVPILNIQDLIKSSLKSSSKFLNVFHNSEKNKIKNKYIIVVEDSITSRTLLKNILETCGYCVKTAVDGLEGWKMIKKEKFDLVITDVEMPKMDGFELTEKIRNDSEIYEMPVILVTSLESKQDKERGIDVGASAYIIKGDFEQSNLLDIVKRLI